jgi:hypothetical protein
MGHSTLFQMSALYNGLPSASCRRRPQLTATATDLTLLALRPVHPGGSSDSRGLQEDAFHSLVPPGQARRRPGKMTAIASVAVSYGPAGTRPTVTG